MPSFTAHLNGCDPGSLSPIGFSLARCHDKSDGNGKRIRARPTHLKFPELKAVAPER
jgi:hypothetical protein